MQFNMREITDWPLEKWITFVIWGWQNRYSIEQCISAGQMCWMEEQSGGKISVKYALKLNSNLHPVWFE